MLLQYEPYRNYIKYCLIATFIRLYKMWSKKKRKNPFLSKNVNFKSYLKKPPEQKKFPQFYADIQMCIGPMKINASIIK